MGLKIIFYIVSLRFTETGITWLHDVQINKKTGQYFGQNMISCGSQKRRNESN